ncbi:hypothetical protein NQ314_010167 [Rhamnusium bicolor]|uniref:AMP-dependent synthetase/ligase domain-containing protein n=1 Tax=Rhamnusium bicolor TaxID=1586634 RepID=A0AAV8XTQ4_9CUCU|nr:hypothetical protein NQ314_010167 [Rhamnusium bicolor]
MLIDSTTGKKESFASVKERSTRAAIHMSKLGINPEDVILFCSRNTLNSIIPVLASLYLGAKVASTDPTLSVRDCAHCISLVTPTFIFVEQDSVNLIEDSLLEAKFKANIIVIGESMIYKKFSDLQSASSEEEKFRPILNVDCHDTAFIYFSSGTTGLPKGICLTHFGLLNSVLSM